MGRRESCSLVGGGVCPRIVDSCLSYEGGVVRGRSDDIIGGWCLSVVQQ